MTERERLLELVDNFYGNSYGDFADYLIANQVGFVPIGRNITENHPVDEFVCSECGFICEDWLEVVYDEETNDTNGREFEFKYCPNCGCKITDFWKERENK